MWISVLLTVVFASYFVAIADDLFSIFKGNKKGSRVMNRLPFFVFCRLFFNGKFVYEVFGTGVFVYYK